MRTADMFLCPLILRILVFAILSFGCGARLTASEPITIDTRNARAVKLSEVLKNPERFNYQTVSFVALLHVTAGASVLYQNERDALTETMPRSIPIKPFVNDQSDTKFDNHWVKVTGMLRMVSNAALARRKHLPLGELILAEIVPLSPVSLPNKRVYVVLQNNTPSRLKVALSYDEGHVSATSFELEPGMSELSPFRACNISVEDESGKHVFRQRLNPSKLPKTYLDSEEGAYYYRITTNKLELVTPDIGQRWLRKTQRNRKKPVN